MAGVLPPSPGLEPPWSTLATAPTLPRLLSGQSCHGPASTLRHNLPPSCLHASAHVVSPAKSSLCLSKPAHPPWPIPGPFHRHPSLAWPLYPFIHSHLLPGRPCRGRDRSSSNHDWHDPCPMELEPLTAMSCASCMLCPWPGWRIRSQGPSPTQPLCSAALGKSLPHSGQSCFHSC